LSPSGELLACDPSLSPAVAPLLPVDSVVASPVLVSAPADSLLFVGGGAPA
jgi:hypothetical protein